MGLIRQLEHQTLRIVRQGRGMVQNIGGMTIWTKSCPYLYIRHTNARRIILIDYRHDLPFSIKDDEHDHRASKQGHIQAIYPKPKPFFLKPLGSTELLPLHQTRSGCRDLCMKTHPKLCAL